MPTEEEVQELEEAARELQDLFKITDDAEIEMMALYKANAALSANISEVHKKRADWYFGFLKDAKGWIGQLMMDMDHKDLPHHLVVFHNKLAKIVEIVEAEKEK